MTLKDQVLVIGGFKGARVGRPDHGAGFRKQIRESNPRLGARITDDSVIVIYSQTGLDLEVPELYGVLHVEGILIDIVVLIEFEK
jgi:hypothetical protein